MAQSSEYLLKKVRIFLTDLVEQQIIFQSRISASRLLSNSALYFFEVQNYLCGRGNENTKNIRHIQNLHLPVARLFSAASILGPTLMLSPVQSKVIPLISKFVAEKKIPDDYIFTANYPHRQM